MYLISPHRANYPTYFNGIFGPDFTGIFAGIWPDDKFKNWPF
jgi:hypothetical protein